jgi:hypothetical protein
MVNDIHEKKELISAEELKKMIFHLEQELELLLIVHAYELVRDLTFKLHYTCVNCVLATKILTAKGFIVRQAENANEIIISLTA